MTIKIRKADTIYRKQGGWFDARWHFSFDDYHDPEYISLGNMRVFNDDRLIAGAAWPMHPHRDVEGLTYVAEGTFKHEDNLGNGGVLPAGSVQRMTLGSGAYHSEQNGSETEPMRFIQIWIVPRERGLPPSVEQKALGLVDRENRLLRVIGPARDGGSILVHGDASMYISHLDAGRSVEHVFEAGYGGYLYVLSGSASVNGQALRNGDAAMISDELGIKIEAAKTAELILMEVRLA